MSSTSHNSATLDRDDGVRVEDLFRRAAFDFARTTARLVESSRALGRNTKVPYSALVDIEHARDLISGLIMPSVSKVPAAFADRENTILTTGDIRDCVSDLAGKVRTATAPPCPHDLVQEHVHDNILHSPPIVRTPLPRDVALARLDEAPLPPKKRSKVRHTMDLNLPVRSRNGKMLWADIDCPDCPSVATKRCQKDDGSPIEKPHPSRKTLADTLAAANKENEEQIAA